LPRIIKIILFFILFVMFFEAGFISSYTIVTSQPPDVGKLIDMQVGNITAVLRGIDQYFKVEYGKEVLKILNPESVAEMLKNRGKLDGINLSTLSASTHDDIEKDTIAVNITATGYRETVVEQGGQITISPKETYSINATAMAKTKESGVEVDVNTINITAIGKIYQAAAPANSSY